MKKIAIVAVILIAASCTGLAAIRVLRIGPVCAGGGLVDDPQIPESAAR
jgi:hypothetical protein